jgi:hypothetical protein
MPGYISLDSIHEPSNGALVPAAWGHGIRDNFDALHRPYSFILRRQDEYFTEAFASDSLVDIPFPTVERHTGEFFTQDNSTVSTFTVPVDGYYYAACHMDIYNGLAYDADTTAFVALLITDDSDASHYVLRSSSHLPIVSPSFGGLVKMTAGAKYSFVFWQTSGSDAFLTGTASITHLGRLL